MLSALLSALGAQATIRYRYINQRINPANPGYQLDIDQDGTYEYYFLYASASNDLTINCSSAASRPYFLGSPASGSPALLEAGQPQTPYSWINTPGAISSAYDNLYRYIMVRFKIGTGNYYGWIYVRRTPAKPELEIICVAYQDENETTVTPGEGQQLAVTTNSQEPLHCLLKKNELQVSCIENREIAVIVADQGGKIVAKFRPTRDSKLDISLSAGLYIISCYEPGGGRLLLSSKAVLTD